VLCYLDPVIDTKVCPFMHLYVTVEQHTLCTVVPLLMNTYVANSPHILMIIHRKYYYVISFTAQELTETHVNPHKQIYLYLQILLLTFWSRGLLEKLYFCLVKKCPRILWNLKFSCHVYRSPPLVPEPNSPSPCPSTLFLEGPSVVVITGI